MTDAPPGVLVRYARFLEYQNRRREIAADSARPHPPPALEAATSPEAAAASTQPLTGADTS